MKKSIVKRYYLISIFIALCVGFIFPLITLQFVTSFKGNIYFYVFSALCDAMSILFVLSLLYLFKKNVLVYIQTISRGIQHKNIEEIKSITYSNDILGEIAKISIEFILQQEQLKNTLLEKEIAELEIKELELQYRQIFENSPLIKIILDFETLKIVDANHAACNFYDYPYEEIIQKKIFDIENSSFRELREYIDTFNWKSKGFRIKKEHRLSNDDVRDVEIFAGIALLGGKHSILYNVVDITDKMILEKENKKKTEELEKSNEIKDTLFSVIAHDLKGPVGSLNLLLTEITDKDNSYSTEEIMEFINMIRDSNQRVYTLLINLLDWTRIQKGIILYKPQRVNVHEAIFEVINLLSSLSLHKGIVIEYQKTENSFAFVDESMIKTVIRNIISNAIKYTECNGKIEILVKNISNYLEIIISDNGIGMSQSKIAQLHSDEINISEFGTEGEKGTGIGISLCLDFIHKNKGNMSIESELGKGTKITICLPIQSEYISGSINK